MEALGNLVSGLTSAVQTGVEKAKGVVTGTPATPAPSVTDGYPQPYQGARRKKSKKTKKGGRKSRRKTARRV